MSKSQEPTKKIKSEDSIYSEGDLSDFLPVPPDGGYGWVIVFASFVCNVIVDGIGYSFGIFLSEFVEYFDETRSKVSLVGSLLCGVYMCVGPIVSGLTNTFGCRVVTIAGSTIATVAFVLAGFSPNITILMLTYGVMGGIGFGMIYLPSIVSVGYYFDRKRAMATGMVVCGTGVGTFIFSPITEALLETFHWRNALLIMAGIIFNGCVCGMLMRPLESSKKKKTKNVEENIPVTESALDLFIEPGKECKKNSSLTESSCMGPSPSNELEGSKNSVESSKSVDKADCLQPMCRKDIFYSGSVVNIREYKSHTSMTSYTASVTTIPRAVKGEPECRLWKYCPCLPKPIKDVLQQMLDVSILTNLSFILICLGNVLAMLGFYVPYVYLVDKATLQGIDKHRAAFLLSVIGITSTFGRVVSGIMADCIRGRNLIINNFAMVFAGAAVLLTPFCENYESLCVVATVYGLSTAAYTSLTSIILCDLLGLEKLTNAFGLLSMSRGISGIIGPPLAGAVFQATGHYDVSFFLGGGLFLLGAGFHFLLHLTCVKRLSLKKVKSQDRRMISKISIKMEDEKICVDEKPTTP
ncbi:hypothetical protein ACJMK2_026298 [Sinanodonta woodiana]|uniref:Major facilitator superfamily (MFS) profile domain-containing protein n=1 Tax=Sinanodonta woodiana TaxID=1069815 RepID=A0ABD3XKZ6_SINWO